MYGTAIPHHKNYDGIQRMCKSCSIEFEFTHDVNRIYNSNYDILILNDKFIDPYSIPSNIKVIYGPQFFVFPSGPVAGPLKQDLVGRCVFNVLSTWIQHTYIEMAESMIMPIVQFPFAVDTDRFKPDLTSKTLDCVVYIKRRSKQLVDYTLNLLNEKKISYKAFTYGSYNEHDYLNTLRTAKFMLTLDAHESQGFALEEAMSCDIPLLVVDAMSMHDEMGDGYTSTYKHLHPKKLISTSVPYWSDECGLKIIEQIEISSAIDTMMDKYNTFTPRQFIVKTLSNEVCMRRILDYLNVTNYRGTN